MYKTLIVMLAVAVLLAGSSLAQDKACRTVEVTGPPLVTPDFGICNTGESLKVVNQYAGPIAVGFNTPTPTDTLLHDSSIAFYCTDNPGDCYTVIVTTKSGAVITSAGCAVTAGDEIPTTPTLSEWGLIIFSLLILTLATVVVVRRRTAMNAAGAGSDVSTTIHGPLFVPQLYFKTLLVTLGMAAVVLVVATILSTSVPIRDFAGTIISAAIVAYMAHLWLHSAKKE